MKLKVDFSALVKLGKIMSPEGSDFILDHYVYVSEPLDDELLTGKDVEVGELDHGTPLLSFQGRQVLLYIKDHGSYFDAALHDGEKGRRFHVAHCKTLELARNENRFQRYVATNRLDGNFLIEDPGGRGRVRREKVAQLKVCMNCLRHLNYKNVAQKGHLHKVFREFSIADFFSTYSTCFPYKPKSLSDLARVGYTDDWDAISRQVREQTNYRCDQCSVDLSRNRHLCDVHHINGVKSDNSRENLRVLCKDCHRKQPRHEGVFISARDMQRLQSLRAAQGLLKVKRWENDAYDLADSSVHGDMAILQSKGFPPPVIGYDVTDENGEVRTTLEVAWPAKKTAISLTKVELPGWKIYMVGEICGGLN